MSWFQRLQQRISITRHEALTLITLSFFFMLGITGRYACRSVPSVEPDAYAEVDRIFEEQSAIAFEADDDGAADADDGAATDQNTHSVDETPTVKRAQKMPSERRIDINRASASELQRLPRVGPKTAERILAFRTDFGPLRSVDELVSVRGIGPKTLESIRPHAYVSLEGGPHDRPPADSTK